MKKTHKRAVPWLMASIIVVFGLLAASCASDGDADAALIEARGAQASAEAAAAAAAAADTRAVAADSRAAAAEAAAEEAESAAKLAQATAQEAVAAAAGNVDEIAAAQQAVRDAEEALADASRRATAAEDQAAAAQAAAAEAQAALEEVLASQAAAPPPAAPEPADTGMAMNTDEIVIAITTEPNTLDAQKVVDRASRVFTGNVFESLLVRDKDAKLTAGLATDWGNVDETTWEFTLRDGVTFHDGSPFNAASAAYSINRIIGEDFETQRGSYVNNIVGAEPAGDNKINVTTDGPNAILLLQVAQIPMVPDGAGDEIGESPVGTGPYRFVAWERGQSISAEINPDYWGDAPSIASLVLRVIPDAQTALAALQSGEVNLVLDILPEQVPLAPKAVSVAATEYSYIAFNTYKEVLSLPEVRIAMNMAIDKELIAETIYEGYARPNQAQHLSPGSLGFNPDIEAFPYDPEGAKELLVAAGYPEGFTVTLNIPIGRYPRAEEAGRIIAQQLRDIGLDVDFRLWEWNEYRSAGRIPGTEEGALDLKFGWNSNEWFDGARTRSHVTCGASSSKICDEYVTEQFEIGGTNVDQEVRAEAYRNAWARLHENPHAIYLLQQDLIYGMSSNLEWEPRLDDEYYVSEMSYS